ncbi:iron chelate uptake ABC transporter family permease subunit [Nocardioides sp. GXZ039]|uniref:iron chelate uptake ABC transporter family permease subunit n=1 Tax=Nocardioides sp. GXZ039 TaxID=3136018 RepID=UPI0030F39799
MTTLHSLLELGSTPTERRRDRAVRLSLLTLAALALASCAAYLLYDVQGSWSYALSLRSRQLGALVVVGVAIGVSSVVFQTIAGSRILTPSVMGFDSLYVLIQTVFVASLGGAALTLGVVERFVVNAVLLATFGVLLFRWLFRRNSRNLYVLVMIGIVLGAFFQSLAVLMSRVLTPDDYLTLQQLTFASFTTVNPTLLGVAALVTVAGLAALVPMLRQVDVVDLGKDNAIALGVDYHRVVTRVLLVSVLLVAVSAALVGPMLFLGLIVANLARQVVRTNRHRALAIGAGLLGAVICVLGQFIVAHVFGLTTTFSVVVNLVGGVYFIILLLRTTRL